MKHLSLRLAFLLCGTVVTAQTADLRLGMIGLDTSHVIAFTELLNNPKNPKHVPGAKVVAAFKGGSPDVEASSNRVDGFTERLQKEYGVKIYDTIEEMCRHVDAVMLYTVMGTGCQRVKREVTSDGKLKVTGFWKGNRFGVFREGKNGGFAIGEKGRMVTGTHERYQMLVAEMIKFFQTGKSPVNQQETIELFAFMEAAEESGRRGGEWVAIDEIMKR